jgi:hypothetical protein
MMVSECPSYRVRLPAVAGSFYPSTPAALAHAVELHLTGARAGPVAGLRGLIAPHAGYLYSGPTAGEAFAALGPQAARGFRRAVVIGPSHFVEFPGVAAPGHLAFRTPLGDLPVDATAIEELAAERLLSLDDRPHAPDHAIEVELPFLQAQRGALPVVPLLFGGASAPEVAELIGRLWDQDTLLIVSSDLSHFESYAAARAHDRRTAEAIEALDEAAIGPHDACGHLAIRGALIEAARRGFEVRRLDLRNSGDTAGARDCVVGYGAWALIEPGPETGTPPGRPAESPRSGW